MENNEKSNIVRFAIISNIGLEIVENYLKSIITDVSIQKVLSDTPNPVLSKLSVNDIVYNIPETKLAVIWS